MKRLGEGLQDRKRLRGRDDDGLVVGLRARLGVLRWIFRDMLMQDSNLVNAVHDEQASPLCDRLREMLGVVR